MDPNRVVSNLYGSIWYFFLNKCAIWESFQSSLVFPTKITSLQFASVWPALVVLPRRMTTRLFRKTPLYTAMWAWRPSAGDHFCCPLLSHSVCQDFSLDFYPQKIADLSCKLTGIVALLGFRKALQNLTMKRDICNLSPTQKAPWFFARDKTNGRIFAFNFPAFWSRWFIAHLIVLFCHFCWSAHLCLCKTFPWTVSGSSISYQLWAPWTCFVLTSVSLTTAWLTMPPVHSNIHFFPVARWYFLLLSIFASSEFGKPCIQNQYAPGIREINFARP